MNHQTPCFPNLKRRVTSQDVDSMRATNSRPHQKWRGSYLPQSSPQHENPNKCEWKHCLAQSSSQHKTDRTNAIVEELSASCVVSTRDRPNKCDSGRTVCLKCLPSNNHHRYLSLVHTSKDDTMSPCNSVSQWTENIWMFLHMPLQLPDFRSKTKEQQEIVFSHHATRRTRTRAMFTAFSSSIITIVGHQVSEETSDKTDMVTTHTHPASRLH